MKKAVLPLTLLLLAAAPVVLRADSVIEEIIARVNNQVITRTEYLRSKEQMKFELQQQDSANWERIYTEREKDILRDLIDQQLLLEKGKGLGITADTELVKRLDEMRKQMNLGSMEELEKAAEGQGVSYEDFKQNLRNNIITQQVIGKEVGSHLAMNKEEEQKFYDEHKAELEQPEQIRLGELLVSTQKSDAKTPPETEEQTLASAQAKAQQFLEEIRKGAGFEAVAKKNSDGPTAAQGGDLGYFRRGTLAKELEDKTFAMKPGEVTDAIRTKQGFVILKVLEHQQAGVPAMKEVEPRIQDALYMQKLQPALRAYFTRLREEAFIELKTGYVDSGASPNQTRIVETNTPNSTGKELKRKKKLGVF
jgi:peptidyl-prolyl cis-trans isomerase SurA